MDPLSPSKSMQVMGRHRCRAISDWSELINTTAATRPLPALIPPPTHPWWSRPELQLACAPAILHYCQRPHHFLLFISSLLCKRTRYCEDCPIAAETESDNSLFTFDKNERKKKSKFVDETQLFALSICNPRPLSIPPFTSREEGRNRVLSCHSAAHCRHHGSSRYSVSCGK